MPSEQSSWCHLWPLNRAEEDVLHGAGTAMCGWTFCLIWSSFSSCPSPPASFCRVIFEPANYCWAELVTSFSLWICDGCWKCKNLPGEEERKESVAGLMKHTCCFFFSVRPKSAQCIDPPKCFFFFFFLLTDHNMQPLYIPLGHGAAPCRWTIIQSFSSQPNSTDISSINCFKWLTHMSYCADVFVLL